MSYAERNRKIKSVLSKEFAPAAVTVRGSRGTATGWVSVKIDKRPTDDAQRDAWKARVWKLFAANEIKIGSYGTPGDMGCDYGWGNTIHLEFGYPLDHYQQNDRVAWVAGGKIGTVTEQNYRNPGWYFVQWDDAAPGTPEEFYKRDLTRIVPGEKPRVRVPAGRKVLTEEAA